MELYWLEYFQMIAKYGSVSRAAEKIHISQPALSKTLSLLEKELGVQLFDRVGRTIELNRYGESFLENVNGIFKQLEDARNELEAMQQDSGQRLSICINTGNRFITNRLLEFMGSNPQLRVEFVSKLVNVREMEKCDVVVTYDSPGIPSRWDSELLYHEEIVALASVKQFPELSEAIDLAQCKDLYFSLPERTSRMDDLRDLYDEAFRIFGYAPKVIHQSTSVDQVRTQLLMSRCITLVPYGITTIMDMSDIHILKVRDYRLERQVRAYWPRERGLSSEAQGFIDYLKTSDFIQKLREG